MMTDTHPTDCSGTVHSRVGTVLAATVPPPLKGCGTEQSVSRNTHTAQNSHPEQSTPSSRLTRVSFFVPGKPAPQGSKRHVGRGILVESSKALGPWRERIAIVAREATSNSGPKMFTAETPIAVHIEFVMHRPTGTPKSRTPAAIKRPDIDKLARAILDGITNVLIHDDSAVVSLHAIKRLAAIDEPPGADVTVTAVVDEAAAA